MLQDISEGRLYNEYQTIQPKENDIIVCIQGSAVLIKRNLDDTLELPRLKEVDSWRKQFLWSGWSEEAYRYLFQMEGERYFLNMGEAGTAGDTLYSYEAVRPLRQLIGKATCYAIMTAWHLFVWYRNNRFCGRCAEPTVHDGKERMLRCPKCGNMIFPRISPAVIIALTDDNRLLLSKYAGRSFTRYALLAGYTEIGETLEQTVEREVMEEVGLRVKNIRYYKSQPWGVDGNVLMGFYCDLDGEDTIHLDENELSMAQFYPRNALPAKDDGISLTREMIRIFEEGREPR